MIALLVAAALSGQADRFAAQALQEGPVAGVTLGIARHGRVELLRAYGLANVELRAQARPDTLYRIGSITKQFTAAAVLLLIEERKAELDDPISKHLPDLPAAWDGVRVRHLLGHTSGIVSTTALGPKFFGVIREEHTPSQLVDLLRGEPLHFAPGASYEYSNSNYLLLGMLIEKLSGSPYGEFLSKRVFPKAALQATAPCEARPLLANRAAGYDTSRGALVNADPIDISNAFGAGSLCSTAPDLLRWSRALRQGQVVAKASYLLMTTPGAKGYGFGLSMDDLDGHARVLHGGAINGFGSVLMQFPKEDLDLVVLTNTAGDAADTLGDQLARAALGLPQPVVRDLPVESADAVRWSGTYQSPGKRRFVIGASGGRLEMHPEADPKDTTLLLHQGNGEFVLKGSTQHLRFDEQDGTVRSFSLGDGKRWFVQLQRSP